MSQNKVCTECIQKALDKLQVRVTRINRRKKIDINTLYDRKQLLSEVKYPRLPELNP